MLARTAAPGEVAGGSRRGRAPFLKSHLSGFFEYRLQKVVVLRSMRYGLFYRGVQLSVIVYFLFYIVWHKKGYQAKEAPIGGVVFKVKGLDFVNRSGIDPEYGARVWDAADIITPPVMNGAVFITTSAIVVNRQVMSTCPEGRAGGGCRRDADCHAGSLGPRGLRTGVCDGATRSCISYGWCPALGGDWPAGNGTDTNPDSVAPAGYSLDRVGEFSILVKNSVDFRQLGKRRRNILEWMTSEYLTGCRYRTGHANFSYCPVFRLADILKLAGCHRDEVYRAGGAFAIDISWQCNFDLAEERCQPEYRFREVATGEGYAVEYAHKYQVGEQLRRMLIRAHGVKLSVTVSGEGGQFSFYCLSMHLGSGLALFGLSSMLCDTVLLRLAVRGRLHADLNAVRVDYCEPERRVKWRQELTQRMRRQRRQRRQRRWWRRCRWWRRRRPSDSDDSSSDVGGVTTSPEMAAALAAAAAATVVDAGTCPSLLLHLSAPIATAETPL